MATLLRKLIDLGDILLGVSLVLIFLLTATMIIHALAVQFL